MSLLDQPSERSYHILPTVNNTSALPQSSPTTYSLRNKRESVEILPTHHHTSSDDHNEQLQAPLNGSDGFELAGIVQHPNLPLEDIWQHGVNKISAPRTVKLSPSPQATVCPPTSASLMGETEASGKSGETCQYDMSYGRATSNPEIGSLSVTGLGYWIMFDAFGVGLRRLVTRWVDLRPTGGEGETPLEKERRMIRRPYGIAPVQTVMMFGQAVYLMFSVYVCKETMEHLLLSAGNVTVSPLVFAGAIILVSLFMPVEHSRTCDLLAALITIVTFNLAYWACSVLGAALLQTAPPRGTPGGKTEAFLRAMRKVERHPQVLHLPKPHIWQLTPASHRRCG
ncbi:hypothetical protein C0992_007138 [Termitomyces sp. T32_za158]|nr:hypothetical protein C0992_007138 [Termitomyces sp. T32_za158]